MQQLYGHDIASATKAIGGGTACSYSYCLMLFIKCSMKTIQLSLTISCVINKSVTVFLLPLLFVYEGHNFTLSMVSDQYQF